MAQTIERLVVDCSIVVKWKITAEDYAAEAEECLLDWQKQAVEICAPNLLQSEVMSAFLRAHRRGRVTDAVARAAIQDLLALPFLLFEVAPLVMAAFEIAQQHNQRSYDCIYVALAVRERHRTVDWRPASLQCAASALCLCSLDRGLSTEAIVIGR
jgi:predicted nucleic acid-binding protein